MRPNHVLNKLLLVTLMVVAAPAISGAATPGQLDKPPYCQVEIQKLSLIHISEPTRPY